MEMLPGLRDGSFVVWFAAIVLAGASPKLAFAGKLGAPAIPPKASVAADGAAPSVKMSGPIGAEVQYSREVVVGKPFGVEVQLWSRELTADQLFAKLRPEPGVKLYRSKAQYQFKGPIKRKVRKHFKFRAIVNAPGMRMIIMDIGRKVKGVEEGTTLSLPVEGVLEK